MRNDYKELSRYLIKSFSIETVNHPDGSFAGYAVNIHATEHLNKRAYVGYLTAHNSKKVRLFKSIDSIVHLLERYMKKQGLVLEVSGGKTKTTSDFD